MRSAILHTAPTRAKQASAALLHLNTVGKSAFECLPCQLMRTAIRAIRAVSVALRACECNFARRCVLH